MKDDRCRGHGSPRGLRVEVRVEGLEVDSEREVPGGEFCGEDAHGLAAGEKHDESAAYSAADEFAFAGAPGERNRHALDGAGSAHP